MAKKPLYGRILSSRSFRTREEAVSYATDMKSQYSQADLSIKYDITRTPASEWVATVYVKVEE